MGIVKVSAIEIREIIKIAIEIGQIIVGHVVTFCFIMISILDWRKKPDWRLTIFDYKI